MILIDYDQLMCIQDKLLMKSMQSKQNIGNKSILHSWDRKEKQKDMKRVWWKQRIQVPMRQKVKTIRKKQMTINTNTFEITKRETIGVYQILKRENNW